jgi:hypothetical protein
LKVENFHSNFKYPFESISMSAAQKYSKALVLFLSFIWPNHPAAHLSFLFIFAASLFGPASSTLPSSTSQQKNSNAAATNETETLICS